MLAVEVFVSDEYYTVERLRMLLKLYPYLLDAKPPQDPELAGLAKRAFGPGGWREEAMCKHADVQRAMAWLYDCSPEAEFCVRANLVVGLPLRACEDYIRREFHREVSHETVRRWRDDGLSIMSSMMRGGKS